MKKLIFIILIGLFFANPAYCTIVDTTTAKTVATNFYLEKIAQNSQLKLKKSSLEEIKLTIVYQDFNPTKFKSLTEPCFYIFNVNNNNGFVIVSADDRIIPILGYSLSGNYSENDEMPPAYVEWMNHYKEQIIYLKSNNLLKTSKTINSNWLKYTAKHTLKSTTVNDEVSPLVSTTWSQECYYNNLCPEDNNGYCGHAEVGCVAVAMGQIMKYWNYPKSCYNIPGYTSSNYGEISGIYPTPYDWDNMPDALSASSTTSQVKAVATLLYHSGVSVEMDYGPSISAPMGNYCSVALSTYFNYSSSIQAVRRQDYSDSDWIALMKNELDNNRPIIYDGCPANSNSGHSFVCDGYQANNYFHFNWGWGGKYDGYFLIDNLTPKASRNYSFNQMAAICIEPANNEDITLSDMTISRTSVNDGDTIDVGITQNYSGDSISLPNLYLYYYLSTDTKLDNSDILLNNEEYSTINTNNPNETETATLTIPKGISGGTYYILFVADATHSFAESNENNNVAFAKIEIIGHKRMTYIPDDNFEQALIDSGYDSGELDDSIPTSTVLKITDLNLSGDSITDLTGIEDFIALWRLSCDDNQISSIDISNCKALVVLSCKHNQIKKLDVSNNKELFTLYCYQNQILNLDLSKNSELTFLNCYNNQLAELDLSKNLKLTHLDCGSNNLTSLDVSNDAVLEVINCQYNQLRSLNLKNGNNDKITTLNANGNRDLTCIDVDNPDNAVTYSGWSATYYGMNATHTGFINVEAHYSTDCGSENNSPIANAGTDQTVNEGSIVILDGTASTDPDNDALTYLWTAPEGIILSSTTVQKPTFTAPQVSANCSYTFSLVVNDGTLDSPVDQVVVSVQNVNKAPIANAGNDQNVNEGNQVILDGTGSYDDDGDKLTYLWTTPNNISLSSNTISQPTFTAPEVDKDTTLTIQLIVNDGVVDSEASFVKITIKNSVNVSSTEINENNDLIKVYPNPAKDKLYIKVSSPNLNNSWLKLYDSSGKVAIKKKINSHLTILNINYCKPGNYILIVENGAVKRSKKIIVK